MKQLIITHWPDCDKLHRCLCCITSMPCAQQQLELGVELQSSFLWLVRSGSDTLSQAPHRLYCYMKDDDASNTFYASYVSRQCCHAGCGLQPTLCKTQLWFKSCHKSVWAESWIKRRKWVNTHYITKCIRSPAPSHILYELTASDIPFLIHRVQYEFSPPCAAITASAPLGTIHKV